MTRSFISGIARRLLRPRNTRHLLSGSNVSTWGHSQLRSVSSYRGVLGKEVSKWKKLFNKKYPDSPLPPKSTDFNEVIHKVTKSFFSKEAVKSKIDREFMELCSEKFIKILKQIPEITVRDVTLRDGFQAMPNFIDTKKKIELATILLEAIGPNSMIELTSFASKRFMPQFKDREEVIESLKDSMNKFNYLVMHPQFLKEISESGIKNIAIVDAASESFLSRNMKTTPDDVFDRNQEMIEFSRENGINVRLYLSMCFVCDQEGNIKPEKVIALIGRYYEAGLIDANTEIAISDTIGQATPKQVDDLFSKLSESQVAKSIQEHLNVDLVKDLLAVHFHDPYNKAMAAITTALSHGVKTVDCSVGGVGGGCPVVKNPSSNLDTMGMLDLLNHLGIESNLDPEPLYKALEYIDVNIVQEATTNLKTNSESKER